MSLQLYDTLQRRKRPFVPANPARVTMYVCGPTVYNLAHIGNARPVVVFDVLYRLLRRLYPGVCYARNITDIDDKIMTAAREQGRSIEAVSSEFTAKYREDMAALLALTPTLEPHATENIAPMLELIAQLLSRQHAYVAGGHVLFAVQSLAEYGSLSGRHLDDMLAGARVEVASYKRYPGDFVLWKPSADEEPGWDSPWGRGRPGWHLECSAMIRAHLGDSIDIHGGGQDLIFPHHENERAQSCGAWDGEFVRYWVHNAFVDMDGEKMSKSLGNVRTVRALLEHYRGEELRFALLSAHYRSPLNFSQELLDQARNGLASLYTALRDVAEVAPPQDTAAFAGDKVTQALCDDLNTPEAIAELHALSRALRKTTGSEQAAIKARLLATAALMGLLQADPTDWLQGGAQGAAMTSERIEALITERQAAKEARDFARADAVRQTLEAAGIVLEDSRDGTRWRRA